MAHDLLPSDLNIPNSVDVLSAHSLLMCLGCGQERREGRGGKVVGEKWMGQGKVTNEFELSSK